MSNLEIIAKHGEFGAYIRRDAEIILHPHFENGIAKLQSGDHLNLTQEEQVAVQKFLKNQTIEIDSEEQPEEQPDDIINRIKKRRRVEFNPYRPVNHVVPTSNIAERLFSQARHIMNYDRKKMKPQNLESLLFLKYNAKRWNDRTVQNYLDRQLENENIELRVVNEVNEGENEVNEREVDDVYRELFGSDSDADFVEDMENNGDGDEQKEA